MIIHPGFHRTGTTELQDFLRTHRAAFAGHLRIVLPDEVLGPTTAAADYARLPIRRRRIAFSAAFRDWLAEQPRDETLFVTAPALFGPLPGTTTALGRMLRGYPAAPVLMREMLVAEPAAEIWLTTRKSSRWVKSVYASLTKLRDPGMDVAAFAKKMPRLRQIAEALDAMHPIRVFPMEEAEDHPFGVAGPILDALSLPPDVLSQLPGARVPRDRPQTEAAPADLDIIRARREQAANRRARSEGRPS